MKPRWGDWYWRTEGWTLIAIEDFQDEQITRAIYTKPFDEKDEDDPDLWDSHALRPVGWRGPAGT